jgi:hypothetical protein
VVASRAFCHVVLKIKGDIPMKPILLVLAGLVVILLYAALMVAGALGFTTVAQIGFYIGVLLIPLFTIQLISWTR